MTAQGLRKERERGGEGERREGLEKLNSEGQYVGSCRTRSVEL